jgi:hypothetical protein
MLVFLFQSMVFTGTLHCQVDPQTHLASLNEKLSASASDSLRIEITGEIAFFHLDYLDDKSGADSLSEAAIGIAEKVHRPELLVLAYSQYIRCNDLRSNYQKALDYALAADQLARSMNDIGVNYLTSSNLARVYLAGYEYDKALEYSYRSLSIATTEDAVTRKVESYLLIGQSLEGKNYPIEAFRNYISAISLAEKQGDQDLLINCYNRLSAFYNLNKLFGKANHYKLLQRDILLRKQPVDSLALTWIEFDLQVIDFNSNNRRVNEQNLNTVLGFAQRTSNRRLLNYQVTLYRSLLVENNRIAQLKELYYKVIPGEWERLSKTEPATYFRLKALFSEQEGNIDSARYYFTMAEAALGPEGNMIQLSKFHNRHGQFLARNGFSSKAIDKFQRSYETARAASYFEYMLQASVNLESLYAGAGDYKNAYRYAALNKSLSDSINNLSKKDQLLILEIDHETRQRERLAEHEKSETSRRHYLQYTAMIIGILTIFIILIMLGSLKIHEWIIRMLGFFSFIFLFEFIILLADHKIHEATHGEPWKILLIKIFLIAILLPLHHSIEKRVITYLLNHKLLNIRKFSIVGKIREGLKNVHQKEKKE